MSAQRSRLAAAAAVAACAIVGASPGTAAAHTHWAEFYAGGTGAQITCSVYDHYHGTSQAGCEDLGPGRMATATLTPDGSVVTCSSTNVKANLCDVGNVGIGTPTFRYGHRLTVGRFNCIVLHSVSCVVASTGKGFVFGARSTTAVGGATLRVAPLHLTEFLSPDKKVWCNIDDYAPTNASCGTYPEPPTRSAEVNADGHLTLCTVLQLEYQEQVPAGCYQNWDTALPVLAYGQETEASGFRCASALNGITCTVVAGPGLGKGFRINFGEVVEVG